MRDASLRSLEALAAQLAGANESLRRSEERFARAMEASDSGVWEWDPATDEVFVSPRARQLFGVPEGIPIRTRADLKAHGGFHAEDRERIEDTIQESLARTRAGFEIEYRLIPPSGELRWIRSRGKPFTVEGGRLMYTGSLTDITESKRAEEALQVSEERFALAVEGASQGIFDWDLATDRVFVSRRAQELFGLEAGELSRPRRSWAAVIRYYADDLERQRSGIHAHLQGLTATCDIEFRVLVGEGIRWLRQRGVVLRDSSGKAYRMAGSIEDVTERNLAAGALRESEFRFRSLTELSSDWYWRQDENLRFTYLSSQAYDLTGHSGESSIGKLRWELSDMTPLSGSWDEHKAVLAARHPFRDLECCRIGRDGIARYLSMTGAPLFDDAGRFAGYHGVGRNITERKRIEAELRARQDMLDLAQQAARAVAFKWSLDDGGGENRLSPELAALHGLAPGYDVGRFENWQHHIHPDDWPAFRTTLRAARQAGDVGLEYRIVQPDGTVRWLQAKGRVLTDARGTPTAVIGFLFDVTERHESEEELRRLEEQLRRAQRLEAMGTLAGGIAHDFNNILGAILGYGEMALRDIPKGGRLRRDLESMVTAGERGRALVDQILAFSRSSVSERLMVHVERVAREVLDHLAARVPAAVSVVSQLRAGRAAVLGDPTQVHQVLMNLATNALQAMQSGGTMRVRVERVRLEAARVMTTGTLPVGDYVVLEVSDSGIGIAPDVVDRIFDPFFTTKEVGLGTGLGLSLVHGIVTDFGGALDVASAPDTGSVFAVYLPYAGDALDDDPCEAPEVPRGSHERVLVVDDEEPLMRIASETLDGFGYRAVGYTSSTAALEAFRANPSGFDAVVTDERMPRLTGSALIREVRALRADIPTLLMSGYVGGAVASGAREAGADEVLKKPLSGHDLLSSLARVLRRARVGVP